MTRPFRFSALLLSLSAAALAGCSSPDADKQLASAKTSAPIPLVRGEAHGIEKRFVPLAEPIPVVSAEHIPAKKAPETLEERVEILEDTVKTLKADYDKMMPAFAALNVTNERITALLAALEKQNGKAEEPEKGLTEKKTAAKPEKTAAKAKMITPVNKPGKAAPASLKKEGKKDVPKKEPVKVAAKGTAIKEASREAKVVAVAPEAKSPAAAEASKASNEVSRLRLGEHNGKTRLVLDLKSNSKPPFHADLDNVEKLLLIDLPGTGWIGGESAKTPKSSYVAGWSVQKAAGGGTSLAVQLKSEAKIQTTQFLPAEGKDPARLVLDIGPNRK